MTQPTVKTTLLSIAVLAAALTTGPSAANSQPAIGLEANQFQFVIFASYEQGTISSLVKQIKRSIAIQKKNGLIGPFSIYVAVNPGSLDSYMIKSAIQSIYKRTDQAAAHRVSGEMMYAGWEVDGEIYQATFFENGRGH